MDAGVPANLQAWMSMTGGQYRWGTVHIPTCVNNGVNAASWVNWQLELLTQTPTMSLTETDTYNYTARLKYSLHIQTIIYQKLTEKKLMAKIEPNGSPVPEIFQSDFVKKKT